MIGKAGMGRDRDDDPSTKGNFSTSGNTPLLSNFVLTRLYDHAHAATL